MVEVFRLVFVPRLHEFCTCLSTCMCTCMCSVFDITIPITNDTCVFFYSHFQVEILILLIEEGADIKRMCCAYSDPMSPVHVATKLAFESGLTRITKCCAMHIHVHVDHVEFFSSVFQFLCLVYCTHDMHHHLLTPLPVCYLSLVDTRRFHWNSGSYLSEVFFSFQWTSCGQKQLYSSSHRNEIEGYPDQLEGEEFIYRLVHVCTW